jgi:CheY-like chemotaxis protein
MQETLSDMGACIVTATSGEEALRCVLDDDFAAILMDVRMTGIDGFTTARMIRERKRSRYTPIIVITAASEDFPRCSRATRRARSTTSRSP